MTRDARSNNSSLGGVRFKIFTPIESRQSGAVLIIVLWISAGLVMVALLFGHSMLLEYRVADQMAAGTQSLQTIESVVRYVTSVLENQDTPGVVPDVDTYTAEFGTIGDSYFWLIGRDPSGSSGTTPVFRLVDESAKLNLNTATVDMLKLLPNMTDEFAAAIVDWRDEDNEVTSNGAEQDAYSLLNPSYPCKNAPFETPFELRLVYRASLPLLQGEDANMNGVLDPNENDGTESLPLDDRDGELDFGLWEYVTVYSRQPNQSADGEDKINIGGDDREALTDLLTETFGEDRGNEIQRNLGQTEFGSLLEFYIRSQMKKEEFTLIEDRLTVTDEAFSEGLINVNTASAEVLACVPGLDTQTARQLVASRGSRMDDLKSIAWVADVLEDEVAIEAGPYLTTRSYQYTLDIAAVSVLGAGYRRARIVLDLSQDEPAVVYRRDMTSAGWALGRDVRQEIAYLLEKVTR